MSIAQRPHGAPLRVLAVDDHPTNRLVLETILGLVSAEVKSVEDGRQAAEAFRSGRFDVVLMDLQMPVMDGVCATREIRKLEAAHGMRRTPLLVITANTMGDHIRDALAAGADGHMTKPVSPDALLRAVEALAAVALEDASKCAAL